MAFVRRQLFQLRMKLLLGLVAFLSIAGTVFTVAHQARAASTITFNFTYDGQSPNSYGPQVADGIPNYVYLFDVNSDESNISAIEYSIDGGARVSLLDFSESGLFDSLTETVNFPLEQQLYADGSPHTITFYATTDAAEENSQSFALEPVADTAAPTYYVDTATSGTITETPVPYVISFYDDYLYNVNIDIDGDSFPVTPVASGYDYQDISIDLSSDYSGVVDIYDGNPHTITFVAEDPYGNTTTLDYTFTYEVAPPPDTTPPVFTFTTSQSGTVTLPLVYEGYADDAASSMGFVKFRIDGGALTNPTIDGGASTANHTVFTWDFSYLSEGDHTITWVAEDSLGNQVTQDFSVTIPTAETDPPVFTFTSSKTGLSKYPLFYEGTASDSSEIVSMTYDVDGDAPAGVYIDPDLSTLTSKKFSVDISGITDGAHTITFYAQDTYGNIASQSFSIDLDSHAPSCTATWPNLTSPHYSRILTYPTFTCTDDRAIVNAQSEVYHVVFGTLQLYADHPILPVDGTNDEASESYNLQYDLTSAGYIDGVLLAKFRVLDAAGNESSDYDPVTIDVSDDTAPTLNLDQVSPDPLTDTTPTITGSCRDNTERETNTPISNMRYQIDGGAFTNISLLDGHVYNSNYSESFSEDLPELSLGSHTVTVECTDGASHTTTASDTFTIQAPVDPEPGQFTYTEPFTDNEKQDVPNSNNVIWGNGKLRLKEDITLSRTLIASSQGCGRYDECRGRWSVWQDPTDSNILWYYTGNKIYTYNIQTNTSTWFDYTTEYGIGQMGGELNGFALGVYGGKKYLWFSDIYSLSVINLTDHTSMHTTSYTEIGAITLDFARNRMAAYVLTTATSGNTNIAYLDLNNTLTNQADDVFTRVPLTTFSSGSTFLGFLIDPATNAVYSGAYSNTLHKWNDNNNPSDPSSYVETAYDTVMYDSVFGGMVLDPDGRLIFGTANNSNGHVYVIEDDGGTPFDASDDTVSEIASPQQIGYKNVYGISYITGQNGVGDQLILETEGDNPVYINFNSTYDIRSDDTFIELNSNNGIRPGKTSVYVKDYNTLYVNIRNQGIYRINLNRGWASSGEAVALPTRPPQQLIVDNFVAEANLSGLLSYVPESSDTVMSKVARAIVPYAQAADSGVQYFVSTDGGVTWTEVTLGQLQQLQQTDYRVKFKIELTAVGGATPVLDSYSLAYAGYPTETDQQTTTGVSVSPSTNSLATNATMSVTIEAVDVLGFKTPGYNGAATVELIDTSTGNVTTGLNVSSATITSGTVTLSGVQINKTGSFKIRATSGSFSQDSSVITVTTAPSLTSPYLGFSASSFKVKKGETVTLHWASSNLTSFVINPGNNQLSATTGDFYVHPTETTTYTITGDGPYGSASSSLTITVEGELSTGASPSPSPSVSPTASSNPLATPGTGVGVTLLINSSGDQTIVRGQKAEVSWDAGDADEVTVDYPELRTVSPKGSFEFFPTDDTVVTITAKKGDEVVTKTISIKVLNAPIQVQEFARSLQDKLPWSTPLISGALQATRAIPGIGLGLAAVLQSGVIALLVVSVASQVGMLAALNGKTILNIFTAAGILPARQRKGFVHQARNGAPIPFAAITVYEGVNQRLAPLMTLVSDMYGVYVEPFLPKGEYTLVAAHTLHNFPTKLQRPVHLSFKDFYKGEALSVASSKEHPALLIPMDAKTGEAAKHKLRYRLLLGLNRVLHILQWTVYPLAILSVVALWLTPSVFNAAIVVVYAILLIPRVLAFFKRPVLTGKVIVDGDRRPVQHATLTLTTSDGGVVSLSKTDERGNFEFYAPKGKYALNVIASNLLWKDAKSGTMYTVNATGILGKQLTLTMTKLDNPFGGFNADASKLPTAPTPIKF